MSGSMDQKVERINRDSLDLYVDYVAPVNDIEADLLEIWSEAFQIDGLGTDDDFFELGGNSILATQIAKAISVKFGVEFKSGRLSENSTIQAVAKVIQSKTASTERKIPSNLVPARTGGSRAPLFIIHGSAGFLFPKPQFMAGFHEDQPVYAFQIRGFDDQNEPFGTVEEIAADYASSILKMNPTGPWYVAAYCGGAWIALEIVKIFAAQGKALDRIIFVDPRVERGKMRDRYEAERGLFAGRLFAGTTWFGKARAELWVFLSKIRTFFTNGSWIDFRDKDAFEIPEIKNRAIAKRQTGLRWRASKADKFDEDVRESLVKICASDSAAYAAAKLKYALHNYMNDTPVSDHIDVIASRELQREVANPHHPLNKLLPNHKLIVTGQHHKDTVDPSLPRNAEIMQKLLDEAVVGERVSAVVS